MSLAPPENWQMTAYHYVVEVTFDHTNWASVLTTPDGLAALEKARELRTNARFVDARARCVIAGAPAATQETPRLPVEELERERDEARRAAWEMVESVAAVVSPEAAAKLWQRATKKYPWLAEQVPP